MRRSRPLDVLPAQPLGAALPHVWAAPSVELKTSSYDPLEAEQTRKIEKDNRIAGCETTLQRAPEVPIHDPCVAPKQVLDGLIPLRCRCFNPAGSPVERVEMNQGQTGTPG